MVNGLRDPLVIAKAVIELESQINQMGLIVSTSSDFPAFAELRRQLRCGKVSPMFDHNISELDDMTAFWVVARNKKGEPIAMQACRQDLVDRNLAKWVPGWMTGLYVMRSELVVLAELVAPKSSLAHSLSGVGVYHGEVWLNRGFRNQELCPLFSRLAMILSLIKWQPDVIWGLTGGERVKSGLSARFGYPHAEPGFLKWSIPPKNADKNEFITIARRSDLEHLAHETVARQL